jgi:hypothetical protein
MSDIREDDLILVAVLPRRQDREIARLLGWYRIPMVGSPKTVRVDWLVFFQTGAFGSERWSLREYAQVRGVELHPREGLLQADAGHPRAQEPYYKMQIGPLQRLPHPIPAERMRRFTFQFTTGGRLLAAREFRDLRVPGGDEHDALWRLLAERARDNPGRWGEDGRLGEADRPGAARLSR